MLIKVINGFSRIQIITVYQCNQLLKYHYEMVDLR